MAYKQMNKTEEELLSIMSSKHRDVLMPVIVFFGLEVVFGTIGNSLVLYVFFFRYKACNFRYFVLGLGVADLLSCLATIPGEMVTQLFWFDYPVPQICKAKDYFNPLTACSEAALLALIAIDRHRKVCHPLGWQIKLRGARFACIGIFIVSACLAIPTSIFWGVRTRQETFRNRSINVTICEKDQKYLNTNYALGTTAFNGCLVFLSLIIMIILYVLIVKKMTYKRRELKRRTYLKSTKETTETSMQVVGSDQTTPNSTSHNTGSDNTIETCRNLYDNIRAKVMCPKWKKGKDESAIFDKVRRKTMIGLYLAVTFIFTTFVYWLMITIVAEGVLQKLDNSGKAVYTFFLRLYFINHVINPVLYGLMDPQFQAEMRRLKERCVNVLHI